MFLSGCTCVDGVRLRVLGADVLPIQVNDIRRRKNAASATKSRANFEPPPPAQLDPDLTAELRFKLLNATQNLGCCIPAVHALCSSRFEHDIIETVPNLQLPEVSDILSPELAHYSEVEIYASPFPIAYLPHKTFDSTKAVGFEEEKNRFINSVSYSKTELESICKLTVGQSKNVEWYNQRMGSLTASNFGAILRFQSSGRGRPDGLIKRIQNYTQRGMTKAPITNVASLNWGLRCEPIARKAYQDTVQRSLLHSNVSIVESGLCVSNTEPYLRASPDGIVSCACHSDKWLLEIKCPWTARNLDPIEAIETGRVKYVHKMGDTYCLMPCDPMGYYEQVQGTMAVTGLTRCDFVLWTLRGTLVIHVPFDLEFWQMSAKPRLIHFFTNFVVAEILTERVWKALPLFETDDNSQETSNSSPSHIDVCDCDSLLLQRDELSGENPLFDVDFDDDFCAQDFAECSALLDAVDDRSMQFITIMLSTKKLSAKYIFDRKMCALQRTIHLFYVIIVRLQSHYYLFRLHNWRHIVPHVNILILIIG